MKKSMFFVVLVLVLSLAFSVSAQNLTSWGTELPDDAAPAEEQVLTLTCKENKYMDPAASFYDSNKSCGTVWLWERLVMLDVDGNIVPGCAESWEISEDGLSWTFHLRDGLKWSDGSDLVAGDFEFALKRQLTPSTGSTWAWFYSAIKNADAVNSGQVDPQELGIKAIDDKTVVIETESLCTYLPLLMTYPSSAPIPQKIVEEYGDNWSLNPETCLTNSPWKLEKYDTGVQIVLGPNTNYVGIHQPKIERFVMLPTDGTADFAAYQADEISAIFADQDDRQLKGSDYRMAKADPVMSEELLAYPYFATRYLFFDPNVAPWDDIRVRQAFTHAIDRDILLNVLFDGLGSPAYGMLPPGFPAYVEGQNDDYQKFDLELAKSLLAEAGYPNGEGFPEVELWYANNDQDRVKTAEILEQMFKENLGVTVKLQPVESKIFNETFNAGQVYFGIHNWEYDFLDPSNFLDVWDPNLGRHKAWNNAEYNALVEEAGSSTDQDHRMELYTQANEMISKDAAAAFLYHWGHTQLWKSYVKGIPVDSVGNARVPYYNLGMHEIYIGK